MTAASHDPKIALEDGEIDAPATSLDGSSSPAQAAKAYDSVRDAFSKIGVRTDEQPKAYITMLPSTAILKADVSPATIFDFPLAEVAAKGLARKKSRGPARQL